MIFALLVVLCGLCIAYHAVGPDLQRLLRPRTEPELRRDAAPTPIPWEIQEELDAFIERREPRELVDTLPPFKEGRAAPDLFQQLLANGHGWSQRHEGQQYMRDLRDLMGQQQQDAQYRHLMNQQRGVLTTSQIVYDCFNERGRH